MSFGRALTGLLFWIFFWIPAIGQSAEVPLEVRELVERSNSFTKIEYCGSVSNSRDDYYLFSVQRTELAGLVLVLQQHGISPEIVAADTSLFPGCADANRTVGKPIREAVEILLQRRNLADRSRASHQTAQLEFEVSSVGKEIDQVIYPVSGFRLGTNSTLEILRLLRTGPAVAVNPNAAPPGSIIVSPTQFSPTGPIYLGHAGIVGPKGSIYSADARFEGARTKNFSLRSWLKRFSGTNGWYAFVLHLPSARIARGFK